MNKKMNWKSNARQTYYGAVGAVNHSDLDIEEFAGTQNSNLFLQDQRSQSPTPSKMATFAKRFLYIFCEAVCLIILIIPLIVLNFVVTPRRRGFVCHDVTLLYPFVPSTIPNVALVLVGTLLTLTVIIVVESICFKLRHRVTVYHSSQRSRKQQLLINVIAVILPFIFGASISQLCTDIGKYSVGRLRPYFLTVCRPDYSKINCSVGFVTNYVCTGTDTHRISEGRLSFPSGHASFSSYCFITLALYIHTSVPRHKFRLLKPLMQVILVLMAYFTAISRVFDHHHHTTDVIAGVIIGVGAAIFTNFLLFPLFKRRVIISSQSHGLEEVKSSNQTPACTLVQERTNETPATTETQANTTSF